MDKLPSDKDILVVCAKEVSSIIVAEMLSDAGLDSCLFKRRHESMERTFGAVKIGNLKDGGELYQFIRVGKGCLSYMVVSNGEAALIDTTRMTDVYIDFAKKLNKNYSCIRYTSSRRPHFRRKNDRGTNRGNVLATSERC